MQAIKNSVGRRKPRKEGNKTHHASIQEKTALWYDTDIPRTDLALIKEQAWIHHITNVDQLPQYLHAALLSNQSYRNTIIYVADQEGRISTRYSKHPKIHGYSGFIKMEERPGTLARYYSTRWKFRCLFDTDARIHSSSAEANNLLTD